MTRTDLTALLGGLVLSGVFALQPAPAGFVWSAAVAVLGLCGSRSAYCAGGAVLTAVVALAVLRADAISALIAGLGATAYLIGAHSERTSGPGRELRYGVLGAGLFAAVAALAAGVEGSLPWGQAVAPIAALVAAVVPLRVVRAKAAARAPTIG
ncbi:hypothetical protein ACRS6B_00610 [Nocardia asteroides]